MTTSITRSGRLAVLAAMVLVVAAVERLDAADWPQFLGPQRNGVATETGLIDRFPEGGPDVAWRIKGGVGMSGFAVVEETAYTLVQSDGRQFVIALDAASGNTRWRTDVAAEYTNSMGDGPRSTPCVHAGKVLALTGDGVLAALEADSGNVLWSRHPVAELGGRTPDYGVACSPLVHEGLVIVIVGAPQATVAAFDVDTGEPRWTAGQGDPAGYSSPTLLTIGDRLQLVAFTGASVLGINPADGTVLWRHPWATDFHCNIALPLEVDGRVLISCGENHGSALLSIGVDGGVQETWKSLGAGSVLRNEWQTSLIVDGALYGFDNVGSAGPVTHLTCINPVTGERRWRRERFGKGNAIAADGKLWATTMDGELVVVRADAEQYSELARAQVLGSTRQAPAIADGRLYLRDDQEFVAVNVRAP